MHILLEEEVCLKIGGVKKLFLVISVDWVFLSHRLPIALEAKKRGWEVTIITTNTGRKSEIENYGFKVIEVIFNRAGINPLKECKTIIQLWIALIKEKPDVVHFVAIKPCIYGSLAAKLAGINNVVNAITGLGYNFTNDRKGIFQTFLQRLLMFSTKGRYHFIFQNRDDAEFICRLNKLLSTQWTLIKGCGVDLNKFSYKPEPFSEIIRLILPARLLYDKGIIEFITAAKKIKNQVFGKAEFILVGNIDRDNPAGITEIDLKALLDSNYIKWEGYSKDIITTLNNSNIVVLPSYREGLPKSLIEASAIGRPIITTDAPGCRDCVQDGVNGYIVPVKDIDLLSKRMLELIENEELRNIMGKASRLNAEKEFDEHLSVEATIEIYNNLIA